MVKRKYNYFKIKNNKLKTGTKEKITHEKENIKGKKIAPIIKENAPEVIDNISREKEKEKIINMPNEDILTTKDIDSNYEESDLIENYSNKTSALTINEVISFLVGNKELAIDILLVKEIVIIEKLNEVSNAENYIEGLYNYRGDIIPVINLAKKFHIEINEEQRIGIVCEYENQLMCILTRKVFDVLELKNLRVFEPPALITGVNDYLYKILRIIDKNGNERIISVLNFQNILSSEEQDMIRHIIE